MSGNKEPLSYKPVSLTSINAIRWKNHSNQWMEYLEKKKIICYANYVKNLLTMDGEPEKEKILTDR